MGHLSIKLAIAGMDHRSQLLFRKTAELYMQGICELVEAQHADVILLDMDSQNSQEFWDSLKDNFPDLPVIALSIRPVNQKNTVYLRKPIQISSLINSLRILFPGKFLKDQQTNAALVNSKQIKKGANASIVDVANAITDKNKHSDNVVVLQNNNTKWDQDVEVFDATAHLISYVKKAVAESSVLTKASKITFCKDKYIIVNPGCGQIITNMSATMIRSMAIVAINDKEARVQVDYVSPLNPDSVISDNDASCKVCNAETFLWSLALSTSRGRMPLELDEEIFYPDKPIYMQHWPNLTRLEPVPYSQQITALFTDHPRTLRDVATSLNIDIKHVINLFYAAAAIGYAGQARRPSDKLFVALEPPKTKNSSVLSAIMKKLRSININKAQIA